MSEKQNDRNSEIKKKKPKNTEPWFDDPDDNELPWGAPSVTAREIAEALDKAPPLSYFKENRKDLPKPKRKRREKDEWDDLLKDPLAPLRKGLTLLKQGEKTTPEPNRVNMEEELEKCIEEETGKPYKTDMNIGSENSTTVSQNESPPNEEIKKDEAARLENKVDSSSSATNYTEDKKIKKKSKNKHISRIEDLSKELEELKLQIKTLTDAITASSAQKKEDKDNTNISNTRETTNCMEMENSQTNSASPSETTPPMSTQDGFSKQFSGMTDDKAINILINQPKPKDSQTKKDVSPSSPRTERRNKIKAMKKKKRRAKERKEMKEFFDDPYLKSKIDPDLRHIPHYHTDHKFGASSGMYSMSDTNNMYGTSPMPLDDETIMYDSDHSLKQLHSKNVEKFVNSTLRP